MSTPLARTDWRRAFGAAVQTAKTAARLLDEVMREQAAERAISDFWEAEAARGRAARIAYHTDRLAWERWYEDWYSALDSTGIETAPVTQDGIPVPRIVWWHAHRRTR